MADLANGASAVVHVLVGALGFVLSGLALMVMALYRVRRRYHVWSVALSYTALAWWSGYHVLENCPGGPPWQVVAVGYVLGIFAMLTLIARKVGGED